MVASTSRMMVLSVISSRGCAGASPDWVRRALHILEQAWVLKLPRRKVDADGQGRILRVRAQPGGGLAAGLRQHPLTERHDQAGLFGDGDEVAWGDQAVPGVLPADQRFDLGDTGALPSSTIGW